MFARVRTCARAILLESGGKSGERSGYASSKYSSAASDCVIVPRDVISVSGVERNVKVGTDLDGLTFAYEAEDWSFESRLM